MHISKKLLRSLLYREATPWIILITAVALLTTIAAVSVRRSDAVQADAKENNSVYYSSIPASSQESAASTPTNSRIIKNYTIRIYKDSIAVFEDGDPVPLRIIDTPPASLPEADRLLLEAGIRTESLAEAYKLAEDYE